MTFDMVPYLGGEHEILRAVSRAGRLTDEFKDLPLIARIHSLRGHTKSSPLLHGADRRT